MQKTTLILTAVALSAGLCSLHAQYNIAPLVGFGGTDGWLAPGENGYTYLGTGNTERGLAYGNNQIYLVSRTGGSNVRRLDPLTGADLGSLNVTGVSGGTFAVNAVRVATDGAIYVGNLASPVTAAGPYKVYRWADNNAVPTVAFSSGTITAGRIGDNLDLIGGGAATLIAAGESNSSGTGSRNGYAILGTADGANYTGTLVAFPGTPPAGGDFRLGLTFTDASHVLGTATAGSGSTPLRYSSFAGAAGTLLGSAALPDSFAQRLIDFTVINGVPLLAAQSAGDATMRVYDLSDPLNPVLLLTRNNTSGTLTANGNSSGSVAWGAQTVNPDGSVTAALYALSSNQGVQAFLVTIPEPASASVLALGLLALMLGRRQRA